MSFKETIIENYPYGTLSIIHDEVLNSLSIVKAKLEYSEKKSTSPEVQDLINRVYQSLGFFSYFNNIPQIKDKAKEVGPLLELILDLLWKIKLHKGVDREQFVLEQSNKVYKAISKVDVLLDY